MYIDPLLHKLSRAISQDNTTSLHAFADDLAIHGTCLKTLSKALRVMIEEAQPYGLIINIKKSELHAWGNAPQATITFRCQGRRYNLSSMDKEGKPHSHYKYLGVFPPPTILRVLCRIIFYPSLTPISHPSPTWFFLQKRQYASLTHSSSLSWHIV